MKRYRCTSCGIFLGDRSDYRDTCPLCGGNLVLVPGSLVTSYVKIQRLGFKDGADVLVIVGQVAKAFRWAKEQGIPDWEPMEMEEVFRPYSRCETAVGRIF